MNKYDILSLTTLRIISVVIFGFFACKFFFFDSPNVYCKDIYESSYKLKIYNSKSTNRTTTIEALNLESSRDTSFTTSDGWFLTVQKNLKTGDTLMKIYNTYFYIIKNGDKRMEFIHNPNCY